jgi:hypothetical protein
MAIRRRIGIDTKAYDTGVLTGLRMEGQERSLLQASGPRRGPRGRPGGEEYLPSEAGVVIRALRMETENVGLGAAG